MRIASVKQLVIVFVVGLSLGGGLVHNFSSSEPQPTQQTELVPNLVATIDGQNITTNDVLTDLEIKRMRYQDELTHYEVEKGNYERFQRWTNKHIAKLLVDKAAKENNLPSGVYLSQEVRKKIPEISEEMLREEYATQNISKPFKTVEAQIRGQLFQRYWQEAETAFTKELEKKYSVTRYLRVYKRTRPLPPKYDLAYSNKEPVIGDESAPITITEVTSYPCYECENVTKLIDQLMQRHPGKISVVHKQSPINFNDRIKTVALAEECAKDQDKFWEYRGLLLPLKDTPKRNDLVATAKTLDLDVSEFRQCLDSEKFAENIEQDLKEGRTMRIWKSPAFFVNGRAVVGSRVNYELVALVQHELNKK